MQKENSYILYIKSTCPFCIKAQELLSIYEKKYHVIKLDDTPEVHKKLKDVWGWPTVPIVFRAYKKNGLKTAELIGGYTDLKSVLTNE